MTKHRLFRLTCNLLALILLPAFALYAQRAVTESPPQSVAAKQATKKYDSGLEDARKSYEKSLERHRQAYLEELGEALNKALESKDLAESNRINAILQRIKAQGGVRVNPRPAPQPIPKDAVPFKGHHYKVFEEQLTWHMAKQKCEEMGGYLACVADREEDAFLERLIVGSAWVGGTDEASEGEWTWVDGTKITYSRWATGGGDNAHGGQNHIFYWADMGWDDSQGDVRIRFVCEWSR